MRRTYTGYRFIRAKLLGDPTMVGWIADRIFMVNSLTPPAGTAYPFVTALAVTAPRLVVIGNIEIWTDVRWQIEVWSRSTDYAVIAERTARIDELLDGASGVVTGVPYANGTILTITKIGEVAPPNPPDGDVQYIRGGCEYYQKVRAA